MDFLTGYDDKTSVSQKETSMKTAKIAEWTYEEFLALPEGGPVRYEIIDGDLCMTTSPVIRHQEISMNLSRIVSNFLYSTPSGRCSPPP